MVVEMEVVQNVVLFFLKSLKRIILKLLYFEAFKSVMVIWFNRFLFWHFGLFYFFAQFSAKKKSVPKTCF